jgi:hypothetical protein
MDKLDPDDMTIRSGAGKELKITKETVRLILGLPSAGGGRDFTDWYGEIDAASKLRRISIFVKKSLMSLSYRTS